MTRPTDYDLFIEAHPNVGDPVATRHAWDQALARGENPAAMVEAAENYAADLARRQTRTRVHTASEFISPVGCWRDYA